MQSRARLLVIYHWTRKSNLSVLRPNLRTHATVVLTFAMDADKAHHATLPRPISAASNISANCGSIPSSWIALTRQQALCSSALR